MAKGNEGSVLQRSTIPLFFGVIPIPSARVEFPLVGPFSVC